MENTKTLAQRSKWEPWIHAFRPKTLSASFAPIPPATALAFHDGVSIDWSLSFYALLSAFCIQTGTNLVNDALDFKKGADTPERMGHIRLVQSGILSANQVQTMGFAFFLLALIFGIPLILKGGMPLLIVLLISCLLGYLYTGGPYPLNYVGLSEFFVIFCFGLLLTGSVYYLQTGLLTQDVLVAGIQIGCLATIMLTVNNLRDIAGDAKAHKRTLAVRFGKIFGRIEITALAVMPFILGGYWVIHDQLLAAFLPLLSLPVAVQMLKGVWQHDPSPLYNKFLAQGGFVHLSFGLLLALAFVLGA